MQRSENVTPSSLLQLLDHDASGSIESRYCAPKSSKDDVLASMDDHLNSTLDITVERNPASYFASSQTRQRRPPPSFLADARARSHGVTRRCPRNPLTSAYAATTSAPMALSLPLFIQRALNPSHFRTRSSHHRCNLSVVEYTRENILRDTFITENPNSTVDFNRELEYKIERRICLKFCGIMINRHCTSSHRNK